jgi:hypothetical protein
MMSKVKLLPSMTMRLVAVTVTMAMTFSSVPAPAAELPAATPVALRPASPVSPQTTHVGDSVDLVVASDVRVGDAVVIRSGAPAKGEVVQAQKRGMIGRPDKLMIRVNSVTAADGSTVPLRGTKSIEGDDKMVLSIIGGLLCLLPLLIKGGSASLDTGTTVEAFTVAPAQIRADASELVPVAAR